MSACWGSVNNQETADLLAPGDTARNGFCEAKEWGVVVNDAIVYGSLASMRRWAQSVLDQLPPDRDTPLVTVDVDRLREWLAGNDVTSDPDFEVTVTSVCDLMEMISGNPQDAGWTLGEDVYSLWVDVDDDGDGLLAGVELTDGPLVGIGAALLDEELTAAGGTAFAALAVVAHRINEAY